MTYQGKCIIVAANLRFASIIQGISITNIKDKIMKKILCVMMLLLGVTASFAQNSVTLTFTSQTTDGNYIQPNSITIENLTRNWTETIYYPDTVYTLNVGTSVPSHSNDNDIQVMPNPFDGTTRVNIKSPKMENVKITLTDMAGCVCAEFSGILQEGGNLFIVALTTPQTYVLSMQTSSGIRSLKMENVGRAGANRIAYEGAADDNISVVQLKSSSNHPFQLGDEMRYQGFFTTLGNTYMSLQVTQMQSTDESIVLVFPDWNPSNGDGQSCPNDPTVTDVDSNVYNTVQIGNQCWMKENLRTTKKADGTPIPNFNVNEITNTSEPSFYDTDTSGIPLAERGYLYNRSAAMEACPSGWHLPSDAEWIIMEQTQTTMDVTGTGFRGDHAGRLAGGEQWSSSTTPNAPGNMSCESRNASGFSAVPAGSYELLFNQYYGGAMFWSSTDSWVRLLNYDKAGVQRTNFDSVFFASVRCLRN